MTFCPWSKDAVLLSSQHFICCFQMSGTIDVNTTQQRKNQDRLKRNILGRKNGISDHDFLGRLYVSKNPNENYGYFDII